MARRFLESGNPPAGGKCKRVVPICDEVAIAEYEERASHEALAKWEIGLDSLQGTCAERTK